MIEKIQQQIPNMKPPFNDIEQMVTITDLRINFGKHGENQYGLPQIVVEYEIVRTKGEDDVTNTFKNKIEPKVFNNNMLVYQRSFELETLFQPIINPEYKEPEIVEKVDGESTDEEITEDGFIKNEVPEYPEQFVEKYLTMGAFDFIYGEIVLKNPQYLIPFLKNYILDNYADGWFDSNF